MIVKLLCHGLMPDKQKVKPQMCVSLFLQKHRMTAVYEKATAGIRVRGQRGFAGSAGRK